MSSPSAVVWEEQRQNVLMRLVRIDPTKVDGRQMSKGRDEHIIYNVKKCLKIAAAGEACSVVRS